MMNDYKTLELESIGASDYHKLKVIGENGETRWLSINEEEFNKIKGIFS